MKQSDIIATFCSAASWKLAPPFLISLATLISHVNGSTGKQQEQHASSQSQPYLDQILDLINGIDLAALTSEDDSGYTMFILGLAVCSFAVVLCWVLFLRKLVVSESEPVMVTLSDMETDSKALLLRSGGDQSGIAESIDESTLHRMIDESGPYPRGVDGTIEPDALFNLRKTTLRFAYRHYMESKDALMKRRVDLLRANKTKEYEAALPRALEFYQKTDRRV